MRLDLLKQIVEDVRNAPQERFDMDCWCGTSACAIGWHVSMHPECALKMREAYQGGSPYFGDIEGLHGIALYLQISLDAVYNLFGYGRYSDCKDREEVAQRIEAFIAAHRESPVIEMKASAVAPVAARQLEGESV
jgi:hypothetical protein